MRIAAITHAPDAFAAWHAICAKHAPETVDDNTVWYVTQSALALDAKEGDIATRLADHAIKALREAKEKTFWTAPDEAFETAVRSFAADIARAMTEFAAVLAPIHHAADRLSLVQAALKLTVPGIPDIYQGTELGFYALTDPDNRRAVDYNLRRDALDDPARLGSALDRRKLDLTRRLLALRRGDPELVLLGRYIGVEAPPGILCFERSAQRRRLRVAVAVKDVVDRLDDLREGRLVWPLEEEDWEAPVRIWLVVN